MSSHSNDVDLQDPAEQLELVADDFLPEEHEKLDKEMQGGFPIRDERNAHVALYYLTVLSGDRLEQITVPQCRDLIATHPALLDMIVQGSFRSLRLLKLLRPPEPVVGVDEHSDEAARAIQRGWNGEFIGAGAEALWDHVQHWNSESDDSNGRQFYAKYVAIVQSSGMGKSRTIDEMSKSHVVIPVNLREPSSSGHPPSDPTVHVYLSGSSTQLDAFARSCAFLHALFLTTAHVLHDTEEDLASVAAEFRRYMTNNMLHKKHGKLRSEFYETVTKRAQRDYFSIYHNKFNRCPSDDAVDEWLLSEDFPLKMAFGELSKVVRNKPVTSDARLRKRKRPQQSKDLIVVLAFDEIHTLTKLEGNSKWSRFGEVRRAIRGLMDQSIFTIFLSTSGSLFSIAPTPARDISARVLLEDDSVMLPFSELGFDQLAKRVDFSQTVKLSQVSSEEHLTSYGRPLWAPYWPSKEIIKFAAFKLAGGAPIQHRDKDPELTTRKKLAVLAQRIPIEFLSAAYASQISDIEKELVESHMRVVLKVDDNLETMVTVSPSEPILSEAAYYWMTRGFTPATFSPPQALQEILDGFAVNKGELGELIVALLFIMARDKAVGNADSHGRPPNDLRWCYLPKLLGCLFNTPASVTANHVDVIKSNGWEFTANNTRQTRGNLGQMYTDSKVYFTHFIKVHQHALVRVEFLMRLMARGAAILCAQSQRSVDGIIPFLLSGDDIKPGNIGVIMFQVKNDASYAHPKDDLFISMNPRTFGVIDPSANVPVIRIVFSLAAKTPALICMTHSAAGTIGISERSYEAFDFWVAGLSPKLLGPVSKKTSSSWNSILQGSYGWKDIYSHCNKDVVKLRKSMNPGTAVEQEFWENWCDTFSR